MELVEQVSSSRTVDEVWAVVGDFAQIAAWDPGVATSERVGDGPVAPGTRYRVGVRVGPWTLPMAYEVVQVEPYRVVLRGRGALVEAVDDVSVAAAEGGGAVVTWRATLRPAGVLGLTEPLWRPGFRKVADAAMAGLRRHLA